MEATRKIERGLTKGSIIAHTILFLRNDVFEHLVDSTSDRGKETRSNVDWDDPDMLQELLRRRIVRALSEEQQNARFSEIWASISVPIVDGEDSARYLIDRSLMRPRSLLDLIGHCKGYALNLGHKRIEKDDIMKGCAAFSNDLLSELDLEIRDVFPSAENLLYAFIGVSRYLMRMELISTLISNGTVNDQVDAIIRILLWFGFLGMVWTDGSHRYIYSFHYNTKVLEGSHHTLLASGHVQYVINPAFAPALGLLE